MLNVITLENAKKLLFSRFNSHIWVETAQLSACAGRVLAEAVVSKEHVPDFSRSTVDGYAVHAEDTFGCSESIPALLKLKGEVLMGQPAGISLGAGECAYVPTGGEIPEGADAMVMLEYAEDFGGGQIGIQKPSAPGAHIIFRGDDVTPSKIVLPAGHRLLPKDVGALAALGAASVFVLKKPKVAILSTGDEIVPPETAPLKAGQMRDVNSPMLAAAVAAAGGKPIEMGIVPDAPEALRTAIKEAVEHADMVLISGGSSVGAKDAAARVLSEMGELLFHGLALKPGKPTMAADIGGKPVLGLLGHPVAAYFIFHLLVRPLLCAMQGAELKNLSITAACAEAIPSNHGREECVPVRLEGKTAVPIMSKSGLITTLSGADGFIRIPRDAEGVSQGERVEVNLFSEEL